MDYRQFAERDVPQDVRNKVLEAGRSTGSVKNYQHWRFILVKDRQSLKRLAENSTSGKWVENANFAVIVLTDPKFSLYSFHLLDAGRVVQNMQLAAWNYGVTSCFYTLLDKTELVKELGIPTELDPTAVIGFGYPPRRLLGKKNRKPLAELAFLERYGNRLRTQ
ncbi:MAG: nitroreductase family protein [Thaumarchaeota archaeon]|nr:nitroreductase family protein [Nitrososphaerota archaeon]